MRNSWEYKDNDVIYKVLSRTPINADVKTFYINRKPKINESKIGEFEKINDKLFIWKWNDI